jgi:YHS domain-containing protein
MALVTTESLGYVSTANEEAPLVIPASAPLITGKRAVVYVQVPGKEQPTYEGREITLGPRAGDHYLVESGLAEGEVVVTRGNFKIDSAMQIQAKPSMMNPVAEPMQPMHDHMGMAGEQTHCPVMGGAINKDIFVEYKGKKVYFCCAGCEGPFLKDPDKYMDKLPQFNSE